MMWTTCAGWHTKHLDVEVKGAFEAGRLKADLSLFLSLLVSRLRSLFTSCDLLRMNPAVMIYLFVCELLHCPKHDLQSWSSDLCLCCHLEKAHYKQQLNCHGYDECFVACLYNRDESAPGYFISVQSTKQNRTFLNTCFYVPENGVIFLIHSFIQ